MDDIYIKIGVTLLLDMLKEKSKRSKWRVVMLKVFKSISDAYATDAEFINATASMKTPEQ